MPTKLPAMLQHLQDCWQGKVPLWVPFWVYGFGVGTLLGTFLPAVAREKMQLLATLKHTPEFHPPELWALEAYSLLTLAGFWLTYYIWNLVSVWRAAGQKECRICGWGARLFYVLVTLTFWPLLLQNLWFYY